MNKIARVAVTGQRDTVSQLSAALAAFPQIELAMLFDSVARGRERPESDVDVGVAARRGLTAAERIALVESLAERTGRPIELQDTLGAAMRHSALLMGEATAPFLRVLALFEKLEVIDTIEAWQLCRTARDLAAHDYDTDYALRHCSATRARPSAGWAGRRRQRWPNWCARWSRATTSQPSATV